MKRFLLIAFIALTYSHGYGQYWFGPKLGVSHIDHVYQEEGYESDTAFNVPIDINFQGGLAIAYTATGMYSVYGELLYERVGKKLKDRATDGQNIETTMTNHFISAPIMLRVTLGTVPFHYYINGGPRLAYWLGGNGSIKLAELAEDFFDENNNPIPLDYDIVFKEENLSDEARSTALVSQPNRFQFGLTLGAGMFFDLQNGTRLQLDFRYTWVHSNMGLNNGREDINFQDDTFRENFEYYNNTATIGVAYLFGFDSELRRKGKSTTKESNKKRKKK